MKVKWIEYVEQHREALCEMINGLYTEDPEGETMSREKILATIAQSQAFSNRLKIYIMEDENGEAAGYAIIQMLWSNEWGGLTANIDEMYIDARARNGGFATEFIRNMTQLLPEVNRITLEVTPSNDKALRLYERLGFREAENRCMEWVL